MQRAEFILLLIAACTVGLYAASDSTAVTLHSTSATAVPVQDIAAVDSLAKNTPSVKTAGIITEEEDFLTDDSEEKLKPKKTVAAKSPQTDTIAPADSPAQPKYGDSSQTASPVIASDSDSVREVTIKDTAAIDSAAKTTPSVNPASTITEEDFLTDESEERLKPKKPVVAQSPQTGSMAYPDSSTQINSGDSLQAAVPVITSDSTMHDSAVEEVRPLVAAQAAPVTIEDVRSINFARNQKEYRSPKLAMFMSLIIPGLGQVYTEKYIKAGVFVLAEAAVISYVVAFNQKGKSTYAGAKKYADGHYDYNKFVTYYNNLKTLFMSNGESPDSALFTSMYDTATYNEFGRESATKSTAWYQDITSNLYVRGWDDCVPPFTATGYSMTDTMYHNGKKYFVVDTFYFLVNQFDSATNVVENRKLHGYSENELTYKGMLKKSNTYYQTANTIFLGILINHVVSAVDALISAKAYNTALLGRETLWQNIHLESRMVQSSTQLIPGVALRVEF